MNEIQYGVTQRDFLKAQYLHLKPRLCLSLPGILILLTGVFFLIHGSWVRGHLNKGDLFFLSCLGYLTAYFTAYIPWRVRRSYRQNRFVGHSNSLSYDSDGVHFSSDISHSDIPWDHFLKWKANKDICLLYVTDNMYFVFPRRMFSNAAWTDFVSMYSSRVKRKR